MSFPNMLDLLQTDANSFFDTPNSISEFKFLYSDLVGLDFDISTLNAFNVGSLEKLDSNLFSFLSLDNMIELSSIKNDVEQLVKIFPSIEDDLELLDL